MKHYIIGGEKMDRETVITHLQIIRTWAKFARERDLQFFTAKHLEDIAQWADDAIALLKEDCHNCKLECLLQKYDQLKEKYDKLLKEQEAVKPRVSSVEQRCGNCNKVIEMDGWKACPWCGKPILWETVGRSVKWE